MKRVTLSRKINKIFEYYTQFFSVFFVDVEKSIWPRGKLYELKCIKPKIITICKRFVSDEVIT